MYNKVSKLLIISGIVITIICGMIGFSYAYLRLQVLGNDNASSIITNLGALELTFSDGQYINNTNINVGWTQSKTITITNTGTETVSYYLYWEELTNTFVNRELLTYTITNAGLGGTLSKTSLPYTGTNINILNNIVILPSQVHTYTITFLYENASYDQSSDMNKILSGKLAVSSDYVHQTNLIADDLIINYNGRNNTTSGYNSSATIWSDLSGNENNGTLVGNPVWESNSLYFDGTGDYVNIPYNATLAPAEFTIELAFSKDAVVNNNRSIVFVKWTGYTIEFNADNTISFGVLGGDSYLNPSFQTTLDELYFLTVTYKNKVQKMYLNGQLLATKTMDNNLSHSSENVCLGCYNNSNFFKGNIYSLRMHSVALTEENIYNNYLHDVVSIFDEEYEFYFINGVQTFVAPKTGTYKIELWGAQGGYSFIDQDSLYRGGYGGYTSGEINLQKEDQLFVYVGGAGQRCVCSSDKACCGSNGGYNGGGYSLQYTGGGTHYGSGGGATDVRLSAGEALNENSLKTRIMVAGGGGGASNWQGTGPGGYNYNGGAGGGLDGKKGIFTRSDRNLDCTGGSQTVAGTGSYNAGSGFGIGAYPDNVYGPGGGGGYYGGGTSETYSCGGSSYISGHTGSIALASSSSLDPLAGCSNYSLNNECSLHFLNKHFDNTVVIDGDGYSWTNENTNNQVQMPDQDGGLKALGEGNSGNGYAKISIIE